MSLPAAHPRRRVLDDRGMTLIEVMIAMLVLSISILGLLAALMQTRRVAETSIANDTAAIIVQSYMEQIKALPVDVMSNKANGGPGPGTSFALPTESSMGRADPLQTSTGTPPLLSSLTPGTTPVSPSGAFVINDNLKDFPVQNGGNPVGTARTWPVAWPNARTYSYSSGVDTGTPYSGDFYINMWVWITDLSGTSANAANVYGITIIYTWQSREGGRVRYGVDEIRSIRSAVPSW
jgi:prepilin-type N-terminal cleavage/methylation domain-containing protein